MEVSVSLDSRHLSKYFQASFYKSQAGTPKNSVRMSFGNMEYFPSQNSKHHRTSRINIMKRSSSNDPSRPMTKLLRQLGTVQ